MTPFGEMKIPEPIIVPTIKLIPDIKPTSLFSSTFLTRKKLQKIFDPAEHNAN